MEAKYEMIIYWGQEDDAFIVEVPELPGCMADGRTYRIRKLIDQGEEPDIQTTTSAQRLGMMWQLALDTWAFKGESIAESQLPRHVVHLVRRGR